MGVVQVEHSIVFSFSQTICPGVLVPMDFFSASSFEIHKMCVDIDISKLLQKRAIFRVFSTMLSIYYRVPIK